MLRSNWHKRLFAVDTSRAARRRRRKNRSMLEKLEPRALLSVTPTAGGALVATEGAALTGFQAATFSDTDVNELATGFSASIDWGDGVTTSGTVSGGEGSFIVTGDHTYADELNGAYSVTIFEPDANFTSTPVTGSVTVGEGDSGTLVSATIAATEGQAFSGVVGTFTDNYVGQVASDFTASIDWGDGLTSDGTVSGGNGSFTISGAHTYADEGDFSVLASFFDDPPSTLNATITSTASVADADFLTGAGRTITSAETVPFNGVVATFTDTNPAADPNDFSANVDWGDGTVDVGLAVSGGNGADLTVSGAHTYAEDGAYTVTTVITDDPPENAVAELAQPAVAGAPGTATAVGAAIVGEASLEIVTATFTATEGRSFTGVVATAADPGSADPATDFSATIDWGDGTTGVGTVSGSDGSYTISGSHTYADEGAFNATVTFFETSDPRFPISITEAVAVAEGDTLAPVFITTGSVSENQMLGGTAAQFMDAGYPTNAPADFTGTFDWGDGTTFTTGNGNVTITGDGAGHLTLSVAGHAYADEGVYNVVATLADGAPGTATNSQTGTLTVTEADSFTPSASPLTLAATEGASLGGTVAVFADSGYPTNNPADFSATIDWGDGSISPGTVATAGDGAFTVSGAHAYADDGAYTITATIADNAPGTATATTTALANIAEASLTLTPAVNTFTATEGLQASGIVATIVDPSSVDPASDYSATIDWGDGTISSATVSGASGAYLVSGGHAYTDEGVYTVTVIATESSAVPAAGATATLVANILEGDVLVGSAPAIAATEGVAFTSTTLATFSDTGFPGNVAADFTAAIDWGDGVTDVGTLSDGAGGFTVSGNHTYADEGSYPVTITIADNAPGTATATATTTAAVAEGDALAAGATVTISATEGATAAGVLATFTDAGYPGNLPGDFTAAINWGDGVTDAGVVSGSAGSFTVSGSHVYAEEGVQTATIVLSDNAPGTAAGTATATINVADASLSATGVAIAATEGLSFSGVVANFTDADPAGTVADYTAAIAWGDGATTAGTVSAVAGGFQVAGTHTYAEEGADPISVIIADVGGSTATAQGTATVADASLTAAAVAIAPTEGAAFSGTVATFADANPRATVSDFTATITWGDGATTSGAVAASGVGFQVSGSHTYLEEGANSIRVVIHDVGGSDATAESAANVADAPLSATALTVTSPEFSTFSGAVAAFTDADPNGMVADYTATIDWGDGGATTVGTVAASAGGFNVTGTHAYAEDGAYTVKVIINDVGGSSATASSTANVSEAPIAGQAVAINGFERSPLTNVPIATFTHGGGGEPAGEFTAVIHWGDDTSSVGVVSQSGSTYTVSGSHTYLDEGLFTVVVQVKEDTASTSIITAAKLQEELLPSGVQGTPNERFISEIYRDLFHRQVDPTALPYWSNLLDQGQSRSQVVSAIIATAMPGELGADLVTGIFEKYLGRAPDAAGMAFWVGIISQKESIEDTEANVVGTPEFFALSGGTNDGFIHRLFTLALGRDAEPSAVATFNGYLASGMTREQAAELVFNSHEFHQDEIAGYYQSPVDLNDRGAAFLPFIDDLDFFDRPADASGLAAFTADLDNGGFDQQVWVRMIASDEFFAKIA